MINRRRLIGLITGFAAAIISPMLLSLSQKQNSIPTPKRNLPFFLGWYDFIGNTELSNQVHSKGIDLLIPYVENAEKTPIEKETIQAFLDAAEKAGVKVLLEVYRPLVESENIPEIKNFIQIYKNHPSVYGWYLYDEPKRKKPPPLSLNLLKKVYEAIKEEDKSKPIALVFADINKIEPYSDAMDILMWDTYPCEVDVEEFEWVSSYKNSLDKVFSLAEIKNKRFWNVIQAYGEGQLKKRLPTKNEFRYMFYLSIFSGADSLLFWMHSWSSHSWNESILYSTIKEFRDYIPAIAGGEDLNNPVQVNDSNVEVKLFPIPNTDKKLMIAVNHNQNKVNFTAKFSQKLAGQLTAINKKTITKLSNQTNFNDSLSPYEVRLYQIE
jgi:Glycosyl hydrolases family 2, TIM barrel domain